MRKLEPNKIYWDPIRGQLCVFLRYVTNPARSAIEPVRALLFWSMWGEAVIGGDSEMSDRLVEVRPEEATSYLLMLDKMTHGFVTVLDRTIAKQEEACRSSE